MDIVNYIILGAGGAGRTIAGAYRQIDSGIAFLDDHVNASEVNGIPVLGPLAWRFKYLDAIYIVGFGSRYQEARRDVFRQMCSEGFRFFNVIAPEAYIDRYAELGNGIFVGAQCAILPNATIGNNSNLCVACTVDHDVVLGEGVYLSPGVNLAGSVVVEEGAFIGTNATILPGVRIGAWATVGAGAVVLHDVASGDVVAGVPAKNINKKGKQV
jgi:sugar O-acyltransferase (sialic acid O-acetyltransferase NeuD family)